MLREYHKWHSPTLSEDMELLQFGHAGARVIIFPTSNGRFFDWENRGMLNAISKHIENGWVQVFCVDGVDGESWYNGNAHPTDKAKRHLQYQEYIINEVMPFIRSKNDTPFTIAAGASFGAYHSASIAVRYPEHFNRVIAMSGVYDVRDWTGGYMDDVIRQGSPCEFMAHMHDHNHIEKLKKIDWIIPVGEEDSAFDQNQWFSQLLWDRGIWHAFRVWDGNGHDWPYWYEMIQHYIGGVDSKGDN